MRLIIDTDTAGDDAFSLLIALSRPEVTLEMITICHGNIGIDQCVENALYTIEVTGQSGKVPVYRGSALPLMVKPLDAVYVFGRDGMSDANFPKAKQRAEPGHAVDAMVDLVMRNPGEITILAQAPLTNLALAVAKEPGFARAVKHLWIMGGTDNAIGNVTSAAEFNFYCDPEAAKMVFAAGFTISMVTWTRTMEDGLIPDEELEAIAQMGTKLGDFFTTVNRIPADFARTRQRKPGSLHPDALTCACMVDPAMILEAVDCVVDIETVGTLTRGYSAVSSPILPDAEDADPDLVAQAPNVRMIKRADRALFARIMMDALR